MSSVQVIHPFNVSPVMEKQLQLKESREGTRHLR